MLPSKSTLLTCIVVLAIGLELAESSCRSFYPTDVQSDREFSGDVITPTLPIAKKKYTYMYYNAKAGVPFKVKFNEYSGRPDWFISRAVKTLKPTDSPGGYEISSSYFGDDQTITPSATECYAIGITDYDGGSVGIRFISDSSITPAAPTQQSCTALYPGSISQEYYGTSTVSPFPIPSRTYKYLYFRTKARVPFKVKFSEYSGRPDWFMAKAVNNLKPTDSPGGYEISSSYFGDDQTITPTASECYAIGVTNYDGGSVGIRFISDSSITPAAPTQQSCTALYPGSISQEYYGTSTVSPFPIPSRTYKYLYFRTKARVPFKVKFSEYSGRPDWFMAKAVNNLTPTDSPGGYEISSNYFGDDQTITPTASECYAIGVINYDGGTVGLQIIEQFNPPSTTSSPGTGGSDGGSDAGSDGGNNGGSDGGRDGGSDSEAGGAGSRDNSGKASPFILILGLAVGIPLVLAFAIAGFLQVKKNRREAGEGENIPLSKATA